jgi:hypothetical protein
MKSIQRDELYSHLGQFLKTKGIELQAGTYTQRIQKGCNLLTDAINLSQKGLSKAKAGIDQRLEQMRQVIHEKTAPKPPTPPPVAKAAPQAKAAKQPAKPAANRKTAKAKAPAKSA